MLRRFVLVYTLLAAMFIAPVAVQIVQAQDDQAQQCEGDPDLCAEVIQLRQQLETQKQKDAAARVEKEKIAAES